jgi:hypothetical protein
MTDVIVDLDVGDEWKAGKRCFSSSRREKEGAIEFNSAELEV